MTGTIHTPIYARNAVFQNKTLFHNNLRQISNLFWEKCKKLFFT